MSVGRGDHATWLAFAPLSLYVWCRIQTSCTILPYNNIMVYGTYRRSCLQTRSSLENVDILGRTFCDPGFVLVAVFFLDLSSLFSLPSSSQLLSWCVGISFVTQSLFIFANAPQTWATTRKKDDFGFQTMSCRHRHPPQEMLEDEIRVRKSPRSSLSDTPARDLNLKEWLTKQIFQSLYLTHGKVRHSTSSTMSIGNGGFFFFFSLWSRGWKVMMVGLVLRRAGTLVHHVKIPLNHLLLWFTSHAEMGRQLCHEDDNEGYHHDDDDSILTAYLSPCCG